jgi:hypothetical protein
MVEKALEGEKALFHQSFIDMGNTSKEKTFHDS